MTNIFRQRGSFQKVALLVSFLMLTTIFTNYAFGASQESGYWCYAITNEAKEVISKTVYTKAQINKIYFGVENFNNEDIEAYIGTFKKGQWTWKNVSVINNEISLLEAGFDFPAGTTGVKLKYVSKQPSSRAGRIYLISLTADKETYNFKVFPRDEDNIKLYPNDITLGKMVVVPTKKPVQPKATVTSKTKK